ncbi:MAG: acyl-CoA desaturase [Bacteroidales bacterium]|nr:acyl-CoA desaturase [Bacteroidales bacterium]MBN2820242.1 acyl-CoA desaturase [Bacteroidales bacterium]
METIKYKKDKQEFVTELRSAVKKYFENTGLGKHGNVEILVKTLIMMLVYFVPYGLMLSGVVTSIFPVLICWAVMGLGMSGIGLVTMHDANHGSFSNRAWVNKLFGNSLYLLGGFPANWRYQHNTLHHGYTNIEGHDEDIAHGGFLRFSPHKPLKSIHKYQYIYALFFYGLMTISWVTAKDFKQLRRYKKNGAILNGSGNYNILFVYLILSKIIYYTVFLALPLLLVPLAWYWILLGFFIMHYTSGLVLSTIFQSAHVVPTSDFPLPDNNNELNNNWAVHQLYTTSDFSPKSLFFSWLIGGLNYQVVHHLFPNISHVHYRKIAPIVQATAKKYGLPYYVNRSFFKAVNEHINMLKTLGRIKADRKVVLSA